jgi:hypothetical protein
MLTTGRKNVSRSRALLLSLLVIAIGSLALSIPSGPSYLLAQEGQGDQQTCRTSSGSECTGDVCCADADGCYTDAGLCIAVMCANSPKLPICGVQ